MIQINDKLRIRKIDERNLVIEELRIVESKKLGKHEEWCWDGYFGDLKSAFLGAFHKQLFDSADEEIELKNIIYKINSIEKEIKNAMEKKDEI